MEKYLLMLTLSVLTICRNKICDHNVSLLFEVCHIVAIKPCLLIFPEEKCSHCTEGGAHDDVKVRGFWELTRIPLS